MTAPRIPEDFAPHTRKSGVTDAWEPIYAKNCADGSVRLGLVSAAAHANGRGFVHGGLISALADNAMGLSCTAQSRDGSEVTGLVTVNLSIDFVGTAQLGQWVEFRPEVLRAGKSMCFARAIVTADGEVCARASAVFKAVTRAVKAT